MIALAEYVGAFIGNEWLALEALMPGGEIGLPPGVTLDPASHVPAPYESTWTSRNTVTGEERSGTSTITPSYHVVTLHRGARTYDLCLLRPWDLGEYVTNDPPIDVVVSLALVEALATLYGIAPPVEMVSGRKNQMRAWQKTIAAATEEDPPMIALAEIILNEMALGALWLLRWGVRMLTTSTKED